MNETVKVRNERVDDIPLLLAQMQKLGVAEVIDEQIKPHGLRQGLSIGQVVTVWLSYILSRGDHRKSQLEPWAAERLNTLTSCLEQEVRPLDFSDDRLGDVLRELSDDDSWTACEQEMNTRSLRVYELKPEVVRSDTTTVSGYGCVDEEGLLQFGHSKDHRPDLGQVKVATSTLDPLGMPLVTLPVSGEKADDPLYLPLIEQVRSSLGTGLLYVGDSKMGALATRAQLAAAGDAYLCPLAKVQVSDEKLSEYLGLEKERTRISRRDAKGEEEVVAEAFEVLEQCDYEGRTWQERRLVVRSHAQAQAQVSKLDKRLAQAQAELLELSIPRRGKARIQSRAELEAKELLARHKLLGLIEVDIHEEQKERQVRGYAGRPARTETQLSFKLHSHVDEQALAATKARLGWRVFATNEDAKELPLAKAVLVYRHAHLQERGYSRLKGQPLSLTPMYLQRDEQIKGLIRLLSIALRVLTLLEYVVRRQLAAKDKELSGLYAGNPKRKTARPSGELLLYAFQEITLTIIQLAEQIIYHLTELSPLQQEILQLLGFNETVYTSLTGHSGKHHGI
jgi:transposase